MQYRAELDGFTGHFKTVTELKAWADVLIQGRSGFNGKICRVYKATWVAKDGSGASYSGTPSAQIVVGA